MKKTGSIILSAIIAFVVSIVPVSAETASSDNATMCFDNDKSISLFSQYPKDSEAISVSVSDKNAVTGYSYILSADVPEDTDICGVFIKATDFGLTDFENYTFSFDYYLTNNYKDYSDTFMIFSQGVIWFEQEVAYPKVAGNKTDNGWRTCTITLPKSAKNTSFGIGIKAPDGYKGTVMNIDNLVITDKEGNVVSNVGDYADVKIEKEFKEIEVTPMWVTVLQIVFIVAIILLVVIVLTKLNKRRKERFR